jgi:hypothetical protein
MAQNFLKEKKKTKNTKNKLRSRKKGVCSTKE